MPPGWFLCEYGSISLTVYASYHPDQSPITHSQIWVVSKLQEQELAGD